MEDIVIVSAARTAVGKFGGSLAKTPATELGAIVIKEVLARTGSTPSRWVKSSWARCWPQAWARTLPARRSSRRAWPRKPRPDHQCRVRFRPQGRDAGRSGRGLGRQRDRDCRWSGKHERVPPRAVGSRDGQRMGDWKMVDSMIVDGLWDVYNQYHMGITAENVAKAYGITRDMQDALALASQQKLLPRRRRQVCRRNRAVQHRPEEG
jgi:acetyl-CoA C-acetyltransferase